MCGEKVSMVFSWFAPLGSPPHVRGKDRVRHIAQRQGKGSPPHVRGKGTQKTWQRALARITPACAGKSRRRGT